MPELAAHAQTTTDLYAQVTDLIWQQRDLETDCQTLTETTEYWHGVALQAQERAERAEQRLDRVLSALLEEEPDPHGAAL